MKIKAEEDEGFGHSQVVLLQEEGPGIKFQSSGSKLYSVLLLDKKDAHHLCSPVKE